MEFEVGVPYVQIAQAAQNLTPHRKEQKSRIISIDNKCEEVGNTETYTHSAYNNFSMKAIVFPKLGMIDKKTGELLVPRQLLLDSKVYIQTTPSHGRLIKTEADLKYWTYSYEANEGYIGKDSFVVGVDTFDKRGRSVHFNLKFNVSVVESITNEELPSTCVGLKFSSLLNAPFTPSWNLPIHLNYANLSLTSLGFRSRILLGPKA